MPPVLIPSAPLRLAGPCGCFAVRAARSANLTPSALVLALGFASLVLGADDASRGDAETRRSGWGAGGFAPSSKLLCASS
ncbi:MAG: hypothetical protein J5727_08440, partial [Kiritimatiellae bacterium]|nr:hypothetical protein [Kiritimatiellia bacterium]